MNRPRTLSAAFVRTVNKPGRYGDGRGGFGLSLLVKPMANGRISKSWSQRLRWQGKPFNIGLGAYPLVTLAEAREKALRNARQVELGEDPRGDGVPTFATALDSVLALQREAWRDSGKSEAQWRASLETYAKPIMDKRVNAVTTADVLAILSPHWTTKHETMRRVRQRIGAVMKWAIVQGHRTDDPAHAVGAALPKGNGGVKHHRALPHGEIAGAIATVQASEAWPATKLALEFLILTAARSGEVRNMTWSEFDSDAAVWTVPGERMKAGAEHRVPLSARALAILSEARELSDGSGLVFPALRGGPMSDATMAKLLRDRGIDCVPHGFRSSFRQWCADSGQDRALAEMALAHTVKGIEGVYQRSDLIERRRDLMNAWADYVAAA